MNEIYSFLCQIFLFKGIGADRIEDVLCDISVETRRYSRGEVIFSPNTHERKIGFVMEGKCEVRHEKQNGASTSINILGPPSSFGVLAVFGEEDDFPTEIHASVNTKILFIDKTSVERLIELDARIAKNVIDFLVGRIAFLNKRINNFSGTRVEDRLASFIITSRKDPDQICIAFNCKKASEAINAGRASVYRAIDRLSDEGYIDYQNKKIIIKDPEGLERKAK